MARAAIAAAPGADPAFRRQLVTPEGLDLRLNLASAGDRAAAFVLDILIIVVAMIAFSIVVGVLLAYSQKDSSEVLQVLWLVGAFLARNGWFVFFELGRRAATPGKRALGLRVVARDGGRLTTEAILVRNALREIEVFLPLQLLLASAFIGEKVAGLMIGLGLVWTGIFLLFPLFNRDRLRVGDFVAGTWVIKAPRAPLLADLSADAAQSLPRFAFTAEQAAAYGVKELEILEEVLRRRDPKAMKAVAERIRAKIVYLQPAGETDQAFLAAYYAALRARLEHRLLFGHRRKDKFDAA